MCGAPASKAHADLKTGAGIAPAQLGPVDWVLGLTGARFKIRGQGGAEKLWERRGHRPAGQPAGFGRVATVQYNQGFHEVAADF